MEKGCVGTMAVTMLTYDQNLEGSITILGTKGTVKIGGKALNKIETWKFADTNETYEEAKNSSYEIDNVYGMGHSAYYDNMLKVFEKNEQPICSGRQGLRSLELLEACYLSGKGEPVDLPLQFQ